MKLMGIASFFGEYIWWHYSKALSEIWEIEKNFLWFWYHFFSIPLLIKTWFAPIRRIEERYKRGFDPQAFFESLIVNTISRLVGLILRTIVLALGFITELLFLLAIVPIFIIWIFLPVVIVGLFLTAFSLLV